MDVSAQENDSQSKLTTLASDPSTPNRPGGDVNHIALLPYRRFPALELDIGGSVDGLCLTLNW
jgi:hypothetical protein